MTIHDMGGMHFDPQMLSRVTSGDMTALGSVVTFSDGTQKQLRDCNVDDLRVMNAWATYQSAAAERSVALMDAELDRRRRQNVKAVPPQ